MLFTRRAALQSASAAVLNFALAQSAVATIFDYPPGGSQGDRSDPGGSNQSDSSGSSFSDDRHDSSSTDDRGYLGVDTSLDSFTSTDPARITKEYFEPASGVFGYDLRGQTSAGVDNTSTAADALAIGYSYLFGSSLDASNKTMDFVNSNLLSTSTFMAFEKMGTPLTPGQALLVVAVANILGREIDPFHGLNKEDRAAAVEQVFSDIVSGTSMLRAMGYIWTTVNSWQSLPSYDHK